MKKTTILIVDDHQLIRETWSSVINAEPLYQVIGECANASEAIETAMRLRPNIVIMDVNLPGMNGIEATRHIREYSPGSKILGVSMHNQPVYARSMIKMGAMGYVTKNSTAQELFTALHEISEGRTFICNEIKELLVMQTIHNTKDNNLHMLSKRELEIIAYLKQGLSSREIAAELHLAVKTVDVHRYNILKKMNLPNTAALVNIMALNNL